MKVGLISDTHGKVAPEVFTIFNDVELIIHAGDIGNEQVIIELSSIAPVKAVYGNSDYFPLVSRYKRIDFFLLNKFCACLTHIVSSPKTFAFQLFKMDRCVDVVIYGHTHRVEQARFKDILFINPGSASQPRYGKSKSVALMEITDDDILVDFKYF
ncbi:MAG TPA: metallophosphoesterase [Calditrichaeota bacterium]|nr:metallophosphoesterase [Calditrichota bacterium]